MYTTPTFPYPVTMPSDPALDSPRNMPLPQPLNLNLYSHCDVFCHISLALIRQFSFSCKAKWLPWVAPFTAQPHPNP